MIIAMVWFMVALATIAFSVLSLFSASREYARRMSTGDPPPEPYPVELEARHDVRKYVLLIAVQVFFIAAPAVILLFPYANPEGWREMTAIALLFLGQMCLCYVSYREWRYRLRRYER